MGWGGLTCWSEGREEEEEEGGLSCAADRSMALVAPSPGPTNSTDTTGHGGQSLGFALASGVTIEVVGDSNDYVGKGLSGACC